MSQDLEKLNRQAAELSNHLERFMIHTVRVQHSLRGGFEDLNKQEANVIYLLGQTGASIMRELAEKLRLHVSTMTGIVDKLTENGFVERTRSDTDRRIVRVDLTEKGKRAYRLEHEKRAQISLSMLAALDAQERQSMLDLFGKIISELEKSVY